MEKPTMIEGLAIGICVGVSFCVLALAKVMRGNFQPDETPKVNPLDARDRVVVRFERNDRERLNAAVQASLQQKDGPWMSDASRRIH